MEIATLIAQKRGCLLKGNQYDYERVFTLVMNDIRSNRIGAMTFESANENNVNLYQYEEQLEDLGIKYIAGVDEVGRGPLAGPVVVAAVILPLNLRIKGINDSKKLSLKKEMNFIKLF